MYRTQSRHDLLLTHLNYATPGIGNLERISI